MSKPFAANLLSSNSVRNLALVTATAMLGDVWNKLPEEEKNARLDAAVEKLKDLTEISVFQNLCRANQPSVLYVKIPASLDSATGRAQIQTRLRMLYPPDSSVYKIIFVSDNWHINNVVLGERTEGHVVITQAKQLEGVLQPNPKVLFFLSTEMCNKYLDTLKSDEREVTEVYPALAPLGFDFKTPSAEACTEVLPLITVKQLAESKEGGEESREETPQEAVERARNIFEKALREKKVLILKISEEA